MNTRAPRPKLAPEPEPEMEPDAVEAPKPAINAEVKDAVDLSAEIRGSVAVLHRLLVERLDNLRDTVRAVVLSNVSRSVTELVEVGDMLGLTLPEYTSAEVVIGSVASAGTPEDDASSQASR